MVVDQICSATVSTTPLNKDASVLQAIQLSVARQLEVLDDIDLTDARRSSAELGISVAGLTEMSWVI